MKRIHKASHGADATDHSRHGAAVTGQISRAAVGGVNSILNTASAADRIGISLSGGGIRATIFHLGVLKWLAENAQLGKIAHLSTVSGASLGIALIYAHNGFFWPGDREFLHSTLPEIRKTILHNDIQSSALRSLFLSPWNWNQKANLLAKTLERKWGIKRRVCDLPEAPVWSINCTTFETGKNFRISQKEMGDREIGYTSRAEIRLSQAVAASAGFPVLIGPYKLDTLPYRWTKTAFRNGDGMPCPSQLVIRPAYSSLHLWDGGVYDNLGLEALYKISKGGHLTGNLDYLIVSNASSPHAPMAPDPFFTVKNLRRLLDINMDQVMSLRSRDVIDYLVRNSNGYYIKIGTSADSICASCRTPASVRMELRSECLSDEQALYVKNYPTVLSSPKPEDFELILRHGYETAMCTSLGSRVVIAS